MVKLPSWASHDEERDIWILQLHVQPGAARNALIGEHAGRLKLKIAAPAVDNKANACLVAYMAELAGIPRNRVELVRGDTSRQKTLKISAAGRQFAERLMSWKQSE